MMSEIRLQTGSHDLRNLNLNVKMLGDMDKIGVYKVVGAVSKPLPKGCTLGVEIILGNIQHHRIFNSLRQHCNTVIDAGINVGISDMLGCEII